jgi:hypothetical protein
MMSVLTVGAPPRGSLRYQLDTGLGRLTPAERAVRGKEARAEVPRDSHADFDPGPDRPDPLALLEEQAKAIAMVQMSLGTQDPLWRTKYLSDAQMQLGWALRAAVEECREAGMSWQAIGNALSVPRETVFRQYSAGGPVITAKPVQSMDSPGVTEMHRPAIEAVYAFRAQDGQWFGPYDVLPAGEFTDGTLRFEPAQPVNAFAGQVLIIRFGPWDHDVSVHACQVTLPDGTPRRVRVTHTVLDFMFGDGQTPLRQAMTALEHATALNPQVPAPLRAAIDQAARKMGIGVPAEQFIAAVEKVVLLAGLAFGDEHVETAMRRLKRVVGEYRTWAKVTAPADVPRPPGS